MANLLDLNHGGATHPGARAIVHPAADSGDHVVLYHVVAETDEHITLDDGYSYDKHTGAVRGPAGRLTLQNRVAVTEGSAMFASWSRTAEVPHRQRLPATRGSGRDRVHLSVRVLEAVLHFLGRRRRPDA